MAPPSCQRFLSASGHWKEIHPVRPGRQETIHGVAVEGPNDGDGHLNARNRFALCIHDLAVDHVILDQAQLDRPRRVEPGDSGEVDTGAWSARCEETPWLRISLGTLTVNRPSAPDVPRSSGF